MITTLNPSKTFVLTRWKQIIRNLRLSGAKNARFRSLQRHAWGTANHY